MSRTITAIADRLALEPSMITPLVKRLEAAGFVGRLRNPADERQVQVRLTAKGKAMRDKSKCLAAVLLERSGMSTDQICALNSKVQSLRDALVGSG